MLFIEKGDCFLNPTRFESSKDGGSIAVGEYDEHTHKAVEGTVSVYGDFQAAQYLGKILELINPSRATNIPDFKTIVKEMCSAGISICDYCHEYVNCRDCIVKEWEEEV